MYINETNALENGDIYCADNECKIISKSNTNQLIEQVNGDGILTNAIIECVEKQSKYGW